MPVAGGVPKRVTYLGTGERAVAWTPDGKKIVFRAGHENTFRPIVKLYTVSPDGELPEQMPMDRGILCSFSPDGTKVVYNRRGNEEYYWKRYKGGQYTDIWMYDFAAKSFAPITDYVGKNAYPMWVGNKMYFVSDRGEDRHRQPLHLRLRHEAGRAGDRLRRLRRPAARHATGRRSSSCARGASTCSTPRAARPARCRWTFRAIAGSWRNGPSTRATTSSRWAWATTGRRPSSRRAATSSSSRARKAGPRVT